MQTFQIVFGEDHVPVNGSIPLNRVHDFLETAVAAIVV